MTSADLIESQLPRAAVARWETPALDPDSLQAETDDIRPGRVPSGSVHMSISEHDRLLRMEQQRNALRVDALIAADEFDMHARELEEEAAVLAARAKAIRARAERLRRGS